MSKLEPLNFKVPKDGQTFIDQVISRCRNLIYCNIWSGLPVQRLNQWWNNFTTEEEKYFAACLLDNVIYRSDDQAHALIRQLFQRSLPDFGRSTGGIVDWEERLFHKHSNPDVAIVPVVPIGRAAGTSGHIVSRMLEKRFDVNPSMFKTPEVGLGLFGKVNTIVFIDDILGTGNQFVTEFIWPNGLSDDTHGTKLIYAPLVAHHEGIDRIKKDLPHIDVVCAERLVSNHGLFSPNNQTSMMA